MPRNCSICSHPERAQIDTALAKNSPLADIAKDFSLSISALGRHSIGHTRGRRARRHREPSSILVERADAIYRTTLRLAEHPDLLADPELFLKVLARLEAQCHLLRRLDPTGKLASPDSKPSDAIIRHIMAALDQFPDALNAVIATLDELRKQSGHSSSGRT